MTIFLQNSGDILKSYLQNIPSSLRVTTKPSFDGCRVLEHWNIREFHSNNRMLSFHKTKTTWNKFHSKRKASSWRLIKNQLKFIHWFKTKLCLGAHSNVLFLEDHLYIRNQIVDITTMQRFLVQWSPQSPFFGILTCNKNVRFTPPIPGHLKPGLLESGAMQAHWREEHWAPRLGKRNGAKNWKKTLGVFFRVQQLHIFI